MLIFAHLFRLSMQLYRVTLYSFFAPFCNVMLSILPFYCRYIATYICTI